MTGHAMRRAVQSTVLACAVLAGACSSPSTPVSTPGNATPGGKVAESVTAHKADAPLEPTPSPFDVLTAESRKLLDQPFTGDFDALVKRRMIRAGVVFNRTHYFIDKGVQRGMAYDSLKLFEEQLNKRLKTGLLTVHVIPIPLTRDQLFPALRDGKVDLIAGALTVTPERRAIADFSNPTRTNVSEVVVTAKGVPPLTSPDALSGREVMIRRSSSYFSSVEALNASLAKRGLKPVIVREAPEVFEDDDILEMVNAGLVEQTIVDDYALELWQQVLPNLQAHPQAAVRTGGEIAIGVRKDSPKMLQAVNIWIKEYGPRTAFGNIMQRKYLENADYVKNAATESERRKLEAMVKLFQTYSEQYDLDYLLMAAQGYQESRLDQTVRSHVGAIGVMQVMPATGSDLKVGDISQLEPNIHAGVKYIRFMMDQYYKDEPMDKLNKGLMTLASYNAGPGRIRQLRRETAARGLDPNVWFGNVERIVSERVGRETVQYVSNIYKYYVAYQLVRGQRDMREQAKESVKGASK
jgi:membrane-bound lytic murein transglycosylase MltF